MTQPQAILLKDYQSSTFRVVQLSLDFVLHDDHCQVVSHADYLSDQAGSQLILNGDQSYLSLVSIAIDGDILPEDGYVLSDQQLILSNLPKQFSLTITTRFDPKANHKLSGLYQSQGNYCTQCESHGFRRMTYFQDRPDVLTTYTTSITAKAGQFTAMLANGNLISDKTSDGMRTVIWHDPFPKPCYLFAMVCGNFDRLDATFTTRSQREVRVQLFLEPGHQDEGAFALDSILDAMRWDEEAFDREYDLDLFMVVSVSDFNYGAMENKGLNVFNNKYILASPHTATDQDYINVHAVIGHEYFHNWSGNRVTCRDWFQLSLKEGLTVFRDQSFTMDRYSRGVKRLQDAAIIRQFQFAQDSGPMAHPIQPASYIEVNNFYTVTVYNKGAEVIRMIQTILGKKTFKAALNDYFERFDGQAVTCDDFVATMADSSGIDLDQFKRWYTQAGTPHVQVTHHQHQDQCSFTMTQTIPETPGQAEKKPMVLPIRIAFLDDNGILVETTFEGKQAKEHVALLREFEQTFTFTGVTSSMTPSLLRDFSAPIKLDYAMQPEALAHLMRYETDPYAAWQAGHAWMSQVIMDPTDSTMAALAEVIQSFLHNYKAYDAYFLAELLSLPTLGALIEAHQPVNIDELIERHQTVTQYVAEVIADDCVKLYRELSEYVRSYEPDFASMGLRKLRNWCLQWLAQADDPRLNGLVQTHFHDADNLTDRLGAMMAVNVRPSELREELMESFYQQAKASDLVMDRWFQLQASMPHVQTYTQVQSLILHEDFHWANPNRVRSLLGAFGANHKALLGHGKDAYAFLLEQVLKIDAKNPQLASRLFEPLLHWKKYRGEQGEMIKSMLSALDQDQLSRDLYELVSKSLL